MVRKGRQIGGLPFRKTSQFNPQHWEKLFLNVSRITHYRREDMLRMPFMRFFDVLQEAKTIAKKTAKR